jgi:hypothetical protein
VEYAIQFEGDGVTVLASGSSDLPGQTALFQDVVDDPRYSPGMPILIDYTGLDDRRFTGEETQRLGRFIAGLDDALGDAKLAIVVPDKTAYGTGRMTQARIETRLRLRLFYDRHEATGWLRE